jgi:C4-dicarboxylate transporter DctQ subunit
MSPDTSSQRASSSPTRAAETLLQWLTDGVCGLAVAGIVGVVLMQVLGRLMGAPFSWTEELTRACFIWMVFAGMAASVRHADAARVTVLLRYFPSFVKQLALPIYVLCNLVFFVLTAWTGWSMVRQQVMMNEQIATLGWPGWVVGIILPSAAVLSIFSLFQSLRTHRAAIAATDGNV